MGDGLCDHLVVVDDHCKLRHCLSEAEDLFSIIGTTWEADRTNGGGGDGDGDDDGGAGGYTAAASHTTDAVGANPAGNSRRRRGEEAKGSGGSAPAQKKHKGSVVTTDDGGAVKTISHITVERNRRKQMNEHLSVLRSLMPCFYVKRGDQASIIGGVVDYIKELQQVLRSLEAKKHRKAYAEQVVLSPRPAVSSVSAASPRPPLAAVKSTPPPPTPLSPRIAVPISPRTPTPAGSPYKPPPLPAASGTTAAAGAPNCRLPHHPAAAGYMAAAPSPAITPTSSSSHSHDQLQQQHYSTQPMTYLPTLDSLVTELAAQCRPAAAGAIVTLPDVKVEFAGPNLVLKTVSHRAPGQALKIIAALESLALEILHVSVSTVDDTMVHSFTIKIGIECELSAEELVQEIQQTLL